MRAKVSARKAGLLTSGEIDSVRFVGTDRAGDEPRSIRRPVRPLVRGLTGQAGAGDVQLVGQRLEIEVGLRDGRRRERVRLDDVGPGLEIGVVNVRDELRSGEDQEIDVVLHRDGMRAKPLAAHVALVQPVLLHHGAHGAVENQHALGEETIERGANRPSAPRLRSARDQDGERVAFLRGAGAHTDVRETAAAEQVGQRVCREAEVTVAKPRANPGLIVRLQVEDEQASARLAAHARLRRRRARDRWHGGATARAARHRVSRRAAAAGSNRPCATRRW